MKMKEMMNFAVSLPQCRFVYDSHLKHKSINVHHIYFFHMYEYYFASADFPLRGNEVSNVFYR